MRINWFGLIAGILTLIVLLISFYVPWWQLIIGDNMFKINGSPIYTNFGLMGSSFTIPLLLALNISSILMFTVSGIIMLVYSCFPTKSYSLQLLSFSYRKPLYAVVIFVLSLLIIIAIVGLTGLNISVVGSSTLTLPSQLTFGIGISISALASASFLLPFWLAIGTSVLCIVARLYHRRIPQLT